MKSSRDILIGALVNNDRTLAENLARSPDIAGGLVGLMEERGAPSAGVGLNRLLDRAGGARCVVLSHQDVYLPAGWTARLATAMEELSSADDSWAVLGVFGRAAGGGYAGRAWSTGIGRELTGGARTPALAVSLDELVLVVRGDAGLRFDETLPDFHLYGTDIVMMARSAGRSAYVVEAPVVHNSVPVLRLGKGYGSAYRHLARKWRRELPLSTCVARVDRLGIGLLRTRWRIFSTRRKRMSIGAVRPDAREIARMLGYEAVIEREAVRTEGAAHGA